ncbi:hypothetical protein [Glaciimonas sp. PAMC28666]|uniref:hypothetical protein n=1 Tax=Glaciimonas sp. PAMC28666 TaxID=2807626 RepID=UPI001965E3AC|nr:hypothetical protein [Glaciimonas sp. PAMC28666]QRX82370.1 hypothetical protein JQN73_20155 [Glaciimonas sp. PAMC28666]
MSNPRMTPTESSTAPDSLHQAFSWVPSTHKNEEVAEFYALTKDICRGLQTCVEIAHFSTMDRDSETTPMLNVEDTDRLLRLVATSSKMLAEAAEARIDNLACGTGKSAE